MENKVFFGAAKFALQEHWWQAEKPPVYTIGRELSALKPWRKQVDDDELLIEALKLYEGSPLMLLYAHKKGNNHILNRLLAKARQKRETHRNHVSEGLKDFARGILNDETPSTGTDG
ncbi:MAG: hypothetical protein GWN53_17150 [Gammaproteobacteria bacterium]|uniref:Uncharacterized protein n=1 Tax=Candidatus Kutchimonas denitrificans TaxID=3056748 RepID=A0AAE5CC69_9BACT|nr:hypothetical protein [Candidatus Kutchimonas denitrificans]NIV53569.1 hypothetical protein [Gammaproteobacteria bacterium]